MSFIGFRLGHLSKASFAASAKSSLQYIPSSRPNLDNPADTIETNGLLTNHRTSLESGCIAVSKCCLNKSLVSDWRYPATLIFLFWVESCCIILARPNLRNRKTKRKRSVILSKNTLFCQLFPVSF